MNILKRLYIFAGCISMVLLAGCESIVDLTGVGTWVDMGKPFPKTELLWVRFGFTKTDTKNEMIDCSKQLKSRPELNTYVLMTDVVDTCMLKKGFKFVPRPAGEMNVCHSGGFPETIGCKSARGEVIVQPDETANQIKPSGIPDVEPDPIECRKDKPMYEAAYCQCYAVTPYANLASCDRLLKYQYKHLYKWKESSPDSQSPSLEPTEVKRSDQLLRENLKELQNAQDKTQVKPYTPPTNVPAVPQVPNPRLEKLRGG